MSIDKTQRNSHKQKGRPESRPLPSPTRTGRTPQGDDGFWDIDGPVEQAFFEYKQRQSVQKTCDRCERRVRLMPPKTLCASCVSALECGAPTTMSRYRHAGPKTGAGP